MQSEASTIMEQLLKEFLPDDACPLAAQVFVDNQTIYKLDSNNFNKSMEEVIT